MRAGLFLLLFPGTLFLPAAMGTIGIVIAAVLWVGYGLMCWYIQYQRKEDERRMTNEFDIARKASRAGGD